MNIMAENKVHIQEKEEGKTIENSRFVELSEDDLDDIVDRAEAQSTMKNPTKGRVKLFEVKHKTIIKKKLQMSLSSRTSETLLTAWVLFMRLKCCAM